MVKTYNGTMQLDFDEAVELLMNSACYGIRPEDNLTYMVLKKASHEYTLLTWVGTEDTEISAKYYLRSWTLVYKERRNPLDPDRRKSAVNP